MSKPDWLNLNLKLSQQLLGGFVIGVLVIGGSSLGIAYSSLRHSLRVQIEERAHSITRGLEHASEGLIEAQDQILLERVIQNYGTLPSVLEVGIIDPAGVVIARSNNLSIKNSNPRFAALYPSLAPALEGVSWTGQAQTLRTRLNGELVLVDLLPLSSTLFDQANDISTSQRRGVAIVIMNLEQMEAGLFRSFLDSVLVAFAGTILFMLLIGGLVQRFVLGPLGQLNFAIRNSQNQRDFRIPPLPNNEIGFLGQTLVQALEQISNYQKMELEIAEHKYQEIAQRYSLATRATKVWVWDWRIYPDELVLDQDFQAWLNSTSTAGNWPFSTFIQCIDPADRSGYLEALHEHLVGHTPEFSYEHRLSSQNEADMNNLENPRWFLSKGQAVRDAVGEAMQVIGTMSEITALKTAQTQLLQTNQELQRATQLKDEFLANMSHELRTPLNAILGMVEGLAEEIFGEINQRQHQALSTIETSANHLLLLINDILDLAKIESGQIELDYAFVPPSALSHASLQFIQPQALKKQINLITQIAPQLPPVWADERRLRQVLINLLANAVKFTPEGGQISLTVWDRQPPDSPAGLSYLCFAIQDTGIGIAPEHIPKLFQPFVQLDSSLNRQYMGTGLGLALSKQIAELHGGRVGLTSEVDRGSCFTVEIPYIAPEQAAHPGKSALRPAALSPAIPLVAPVILIAEDNESNILTLSSYLKAKGYQLRVAKNGWEAVQLTQAELPDLILMDIQMPEMDGLEAMRQIRHNLHLENIPIIAMTALTMDGDCERCFRAGATDYISKPVKLKALVNLIQTHLAVAANSDSTNTAEIP